MAAPRQPVNQITNSVGFTAKLATVSSVTADGSSALTTDRLNVQTQVTMLVQRSKGPLPRPGETWLIAQDLGMWTFAAFVGTSEADFAADAGRGIAVSAIPPASPQAGDLWMSSAVGNELFSWSGTAWTAVQLGTQALADGSVTAAKIAPASLTTAQLAPNAGITAAQVAFTVSDIGGIQIITGTSQPAGPKTGAIWFNAAGGNGMHVWDGHEWTAYQFGAAAIAPGSLTSEQISPSASITPTQISFTAKDIGGVTTSVSAIPPGVPAVGDLWFDATSSYALKQWNGTRWALYQFGTNAIQAGSVTAALIAANTITATQIAAGTIVAGMVDGTTIQGAQFLAYGLNGEVLVYSGIPAAGNLIGSWSASPGTDAHANSFSGGLGVGASSAPQVLVLPGGNGMGSAVAFPFNTTDDAVTTAIEAGIVNPGLANQFLQLLVGGPVNTNDPALNQYAMVFASAADDGSQSASLMLTDSAGNTYLGLGNPAGTAPAITIGSPPPGAGPGYGASFIPVGLNGAILTYGTSAGQQIVTSYAKPGTFSFIWPAGVTTLKVEVWAAAGGGKWASGAGGSGGEYAAEFTLTGGTPGSTYTVVVGAGGQPGINAINWFGHDGGNSSFSGPGVVTVLAHGGKGSNSATTVGGTGSANSLHHDGGGSHGTTGGSQGGAGGGGAGGPNGAGGAGHANSGSTPGAGGTSNGGGSGGGGGGWGGPATSGGGNGGSPGGGGGAGGAPPSGTNGATGGYGGGGLVRITYTQPGTAAILSSLSSAAVTDTSGNSVPAGYMGPAVAVDPGSSPSVPETFHAMTLSVSPAYTTFSGRTLKYKLMPDNTVRISGQLTIPGSGLSVGETIASIASSAYHPPRPEAIRATALDASNNAYAIYLEMETNGDLQRWSSYAAGVATLRINDSYPLDA